MKLPTACLAVALLLVLAALNGVTDGLPVMGDEGSSSNRSGDSRAVPPSTDEASLDAGHTTAKVIHVPVMISYMQPNTSEVQVVQASQVTEKADRRSNVLMAKIVFLVILSIFLILFICYMLLLRDIQLTCNECESPEESSERALRSAQRRADRLHQQITRS